MLNTLRPLLIVFLLVPAISPAPSPAADLRVEQPEAPPSDIADVSRRYLENQALLLMIRSTFDVVERDSVGDTLKASARQLGKNGPSEDETNALDRTLLSEASYFIVSLRYTTLVGGAVWPSDKPESTYINDTLVLLDGLERDLETAIETGEDALPILKTVQQLWLLSEGLKEVPPERDMFEGRDALVGAALAALDMRTGT